MKLSLCITNYNRTDLLAESFKEVLEDDRISEIIIADDNSDMTTCRFLYFLNKSHPKIKVILHTTNVGMYENKKRAISYAENEWCILLDSDNVISPSYISAFVKHMHHLQWGDLLHTDTIYCPDFAFPKFDYRKYNANNRIICPNFFYITSDVKRLLYEPMFECLLNTCNYIVNKATYLKIWEPAPGIQAADSIYFMYLWLKAGNAFFVVPNMLYNHRVHEGSGFMADVKGNMEKAANVKKLILDL